MSIIETISSPGYFNPMLGSNDEETFINLSDAMKLLHTLLDSEEDITEIRAGIALLAQTVWVACQYEGLRLKEKGHE